MNRPRTFSCSMYLTQKVTEHSQHPTEGSAQQGHLVPHEEHLGSWKSDLLLPRAPPTVQPSSCSSQEAFSHRYSGNRRGLTGLGRSHSWLAWLTAHQQPSVPQSQALAGVAGLLQV